MSRLLIDGDIVAFRCGFAVEKTRYLVQHRGGRWDEYDTAREAKADESRGCVIWSRKEVEPKENAIKLVDSVVCDIRQRYADLDCRVYLSPSVGNFRDKIATRARYKGNRDGAARPTHLPAIREHLCKNYGAIVTEGQEADDAIGIAMYAAPGSVCVSIDKDLHQLAGKHYNWVTKDECTVSPADASRWFYTQVLAGDATDNVPGCEGIGPVKAAKILAGCKGPKSAWERVLQTYIKCHGDDGPLFALETARLVYVRRKDGEIWNPPV